MAAKARIESLSVAIREAALALQTAKNDGTDPRRPSRRAQMLATTVEFAAEASGNVREEVKVAAGAGAGAEAAVGTDIGLATTTRTGNVARRKDASGASAKKKK